MTESGKIWIEIEFLNLNFKSNENVPWDLKGIFQSSFKRSDQPIIFCTYLKWLGRKIKKKWSLKNTNDAKLLIYRRAKI